MRPANALFIDHECCKGVLRCRICGDLFITVAWLRHLKTTLAAEGRPTHWIGKPEVEQARRYAHGREHVTRTEAMTDAQGRFILPEGSPYLPAPRHTTARDFGFTPIQS